MRADTFANRSAGSIGASGLCLLHGRKRQCTDRGKTTRHETGLAQEAAAIEPASGLIADRRCEIAATCLTLCSLDQHGSVSLSSDNG
jgi:hypothetical protein